MRTAWEVSRTVAGIYSWRLMVTKVYEDAVDDPEQQK